MQDSIGKTLTVAVLLCVVCSVLVSGAAVNLRPIQEENKKLDVKKNLLLSSGLLTKQKPTKKDILEAYKQVETYVINIETGELTTEVNATDYDPRAAVKDPKTSVNIPASEDIAGIKKRAKFAKVYAVKKDGALDMIILPVHGKGLWSTLYGFLALAPDTKTVKGLGFYEHGETPGLGGEVDNSIWKAKWPGKIVYDDNFKPIIDIIKGQVDPSSSKANHQIDGLSGATITSVGVENLVNFWLSKSGYGPFLENVRQGTIL